MKVAYLDCASGISGDMTLGALVDAGVPLGTIQEGIDSLNLPDCRLEVEEVRRKGFRATKIHVRHQKEHSHRHLHHIIEMIDRSRLTPRQRELASQIFTRLAEAEARVHGTTVSKVHFHEVGAADSIADIAGSAIGWDLLGAERVTCSPIPTGRGFIQIAHGRVSVPAPATAELLKGIPLTESDIEFELTTPTGAAIVSTLADQFGPLPAMKIETIGCGAGDRDLQEQCNILRLFVGQSEETLAGDQIWVLETNLDDLSGELIGYCTGQLISAGALDVYTTAIQMKKNRPGVKLTVLCDAATREVLEGILFRETTTLGIRRWPASRHKLSRQAHSVNTPWGKIAGKRIELPDGQSRFSPEYEACRQIATAQRVALVDVYRAARDAFEAEGK
jgi:hypothetical protein